MNFLDSDTVYFVLSIFIVFSLFFFIPWFVEHIIKLTPKDPFRMKTRFRSRDYYK